MTDPVQLARFVVLRHDVGKKLTRSDTAHLDWMFAIDSQLRTFATDIIDVAKPQLIAAERLDDHRLAYLDYQGEISNDRGVVTRIAAGHYHLLDADPARWHVLLDWDREYCDLIQRTRADFRRDATRDVWQLCLSLLR